MYDRPKTWDRKSCFEKKNDTKWIIFLQNAIHTLFIKFFLPKIFFWKRMFFLTSNNTDFFVVLAEGQSLFESLKKKSGLNFDWTHPGHFNNQDLDNVPIVLLIFVLCFESKLFLGLGRQNFDGPDPSWLTPKFF